MNILIVYALGFLLVWGLVSLLWLLSLFLKDSSIVDIFWGTGFVLVGWFYFALTPNGFAARKWLISLMVTIWGLRLSLHILRRNWGHGEDFRYQKWRQEAGRSWWWRSYFKVFLLQGVIMWIVSAPLLGAQHSSTPTRLIWLDYGGVLLWLIGFIFEAGGDWQLDRFRSNPANKGKLLTTGLWRYTRHPNYFGDAAQWWGFFIIAAAGGAFWAIFSPVLMHFLLVRVSGVAMLEKSLKSSKPGYKAYVERTNAFIPWLPRKSNAGHETT